jgi:hypothetical protein
MALHIRAGRDGQGNALSMLAKGMLAQYRVAKQLQ